MKNWKIHAFPVLILVALMLSSFFAGSMLADTVAISGNLPRARDNERMQLAQRLKFIDATAVTPLVSPKTSVGTTPQAFVVPNGAVNMIIRCSAAFRYGDNATLDGSSSTKAYMVGGANSDTVYPCAGLNAGTIYIAAESGTVTVSFMFEILN